ncbi:hypothetical protein OEB99_18490 [Actinotalea sp. M2MS4P-6]|uniref:hypothetical protein n=1 Tax=Actinotalea sp. M2MS4P-6 TaxID=2983762 RepID=UPI0021E44E51|nr:hypothetical protein [Actinotalea sp. M2MS4P-6]MCV2396304.1 hypothetical protein [Actinotalea sp. M2MS4P-6]
MAAHDRPAFRRSLAIEGWSTDSTWGYDEVFECYWAELRGPSGGHRIGPEGLLVTLGALSGAVARVVGCAQDEAYLALTA